MVESTEKSTETKASRGRFRDRFSRNEGVTMKRCVSYQMENDRCKRFRYDQNNKKEQLMLRNNQYVSNCVNLNNSIKCLYFNFFSIIGLV